jgi:hypothetical protein
VYACIILLASIVHIPPHFLNQWPIISKVQTLPGFVLGGKLFVLYCEIEGKLELQVCMGIIKRKTYSEQILEPSQIYEVHNIFKAHIENMIILFHIVLVYVMNSVNPRGIRFKCPESRIEI